MRKYFYGFFSRSIFLLISGLLLFSSPALANEVAGVSIPQRVQVGTSGEELLLHDARVKKRLFVDVYIAALYLPEKAVDDREVLESVAAKRLSMHVLHAEVRAEKLVEALMRGFPAGRLAEDMKSLMDMAARKIRTLRKGDTVHLDYIPGEGTELWVNGRLLTTIEHDEFYQNLLRMWLGA
jgi:hypothetical protein